MNDGLQLLVPVLALLYFFLYSLKCLIMRRVAGRTRAVTLYCMVLILSVAFVYLVMVEWDNHSETALGHWIGAPVSFLTVPAVTFFIDLFSKKNKDVRACVLRSSFEVIVLVPIWFTVTFIIEYYLGWFYF